MLAKLFNWPDLTARGPPYKCISITNTNFETIKVTQFECDTTCDLNWEHDCHKAFDHRDTSQWRWRQNVSKFALLISVYFQWIISRLGDNITHEGRLAFITPSSAMTCKIDANVPFPSHSVFFRKLLLAIFYQHLSPSSRGDDGVTSLKVPHLTYPDQAWFCKLWGIMHCRWEVSGIRLTSGSQADNCDTKTRHRAPDQHSKPNPCFR